MAYLLKQDLTQFKDITVSGKNDWRYCEVTFSADIQYCTEADIIFLRIDDGDTTTDSSAHTGDNSKQTLSVTHTISEDATKVEAVVVFDPTESMDIYVTNPSFAMRYYTRDVGAGCPACGSYTYDPKQPSIQVPDA